MKPPKDPKNSLPRHDYESELQTAVSWLGDRYLLAEAQPRRKSDFAPVLAKPVARSIIHGGKRVTRH